MRIWDPNRIRKRNKLKTIQTKQCTNKNKKGIAKKIFFFNNKEKLKLYKTEKFLARLEFGVMGKMIWERSKKEGRQAGRREKYQSRGVAYRTNLWCVGIYFFFLGRRERKEGVEYSRMWFDWRKQFSSIMFVEIRSEEVVIRFHSTTGKSQVIINSVKLINK